MGYALTKDNAERGATLAQEISEAFDKGLVLEYECDQGGVGWLTQKLYEAMASLREFPELVPEGCSDLVFGKEYIIKTKPKEGLVRIVPRSKLFLKVRVVTPESRRRFVQSPTSQSEVIDCSDVDLNSQHAWVKVVGQLQQGAKTLVNVHSIPNTEQVRDSINAFLEPIKYNIELFNPPEQIIIRSTK